MFKRLAIAIFSVFVVLVPGAAQALVVSPEASDLVMTAGTPASAMITVTNNGTLRRDYEVSFVEARFGERAEDISFIALSAGLKGAVTATPKSFTLEAGATQDIEVKIRVSAGALQQSPTVAVLVSEKGVGSGIGSIQSGVASLLFLHLPGDFTRSYVLKDLRTTPSFSYGDDVQLSALFYNDGKGNVVIPNDIRVFNMFGKEVERGRFAAEPRHLPPGTTRSVSVSWPGETDFSRLLFGKYRFELWDGDAKIGIAYATFFPLKAAIGLGVLILVSVVGILLTVRRRT